jgi:hypothetical protein
MKIMRAIPTFLLLAILFVPPHASATVVSLERDGLPVEHGEICRFAAGDADNPFRRWLASSELTCVAAGEHMEFPAGRWNVFGRVPGAALSAAALLIDGSNAPATLALALAPAAEVTTLLRPGQTAVIYAPRFSSAVPVPGNVIASTVPAGVELWLFVLEKGAPVALIPIPSLVPADHREVDARNGGPAAIVGWLNVQESDRPYLANARGVTTPKIRGTSGGPAHDSDALSPLQLLQGSFFRIAEISAGDVKIDTGGPNWMPAQMQVKAASSLTVVPVPLLLRAAGSLNIRWSARPDWLDLERSIDSCKHSDSEPHYDLTLSVCSGPPPPPGRTEEARCQPVRHETYPADSRVDSFLADNLAPGDYRAEIRFGKLPEFSSTAQVAPFQIRTMSLFMEYVQVYGGVTFGGEPLTEDAQLTFPGGIGFVTSEKGEYRAVLRRLLDSDAPVNIAACDGSPHATVLTDRPMLRNSRLDIDIPDNSLTIHVTDTFTRDPIAGANVRVAVIPRTGPREGIVLKATTGKPSDDSSRSENGLGDAIFKNLSDRKLMIVITASGYEKKQVPPFSISKSEQKTLEVQLVPLRGNHGRIASAAPFADAAVYWYSSTGQETERADLGEDGSFVYNLNHGPDETMAIISLSHPLSVLHTPAVERGHSIEVHFPDGHGRSFEAFLVSADSSEERFVGLVVAGVRVPLSALRAHQQLRHLGTTIKPSVSLPIRDLAETGPIDVILGPTILEVDSRSRGMDVFTSPRYADAPRLRLQSGATQIFLDPKKR